MSYKQWAFNFFVTIIVLNIIITVLVIKSTPFTNYYYQINVFGIMATFFLISGIILGFISFYKKEDSDFKKKLGLYGNLGLLIFGIIISLIENV